MGGKVRIGKQIAAIIQSFNPRVYAEPFCGCFSVGCHVKCEYRGAGDTHPDLILLLKAIQDGWVPPTDISEGQYNDARNRPPSALRGFIGFGCSFYGKFFGGYARDALGSNYSRIAKDSLLRLAPLIRDVAFECKPYTDCRADVLYCDPPYTKTTKFSSGEFDHDLFWNWVRSRHEIVLVSEYIAPDDFEVIWEKPVKTSMKGRDGLGIARVEKLFRRKTLMYLRIKNPGVAPVEGYTLLGASTTRGVAGTIGQFGSGSKHGINVLLRLGLQLIIYCGETKLEFATRDDILNDGLVEKPIKRVTYNAGEGWVDTGWVLDFGALDWQDVSMALREFVSNALDRTVREEGDFLPALKAGRLSVEMAPPAAAPGFTQVFIEAKEDVLRFYGELPRRFLHFADHPQTKQTLLLKARRNLNGNAPVIYRESVFVQELKSDKRSVYDYNFNSGELDIDESRNSSEYAVRAAITTKFGGATTEELIPLFRGLLEGDVFELDLDWSYACPSWRTPTKEQKKAWCDAWKVVAGNAVLCGPVETLAQFIRGRGMTPGCVKSQGFVDVAARIGVPTAITVLSDSERAGRKKLPATASAVEAIQIVWNWVERLNLTLGKSCPPVGCFQEVVENGSRSLGFCDATGVYFADDHASGLSKMLLQTALEEVVHWVTGATDGSRDFQEFVLKMFVEVQSESLCY